MITLAFLMLLAQDPAAYSMTYYDLGSFTPRLTVTVTPTCDIPEAPVATPGEMINPTRAFFNLGDDPNTEVIETSICVINPLPGLSELPKGIIGMQYTGTLTIPEGASVSSPEFCVGVPESIAAESTTCDAAIRWGKLVVWYCYILRLCGV